MLTRRLSRPKRPRDDGAPGSGRNFRHTFALGSQEDFPGPCAQTDANISSHNWIGALQASLGCFHCHPVAEACPAGQPVQDPIQSRQCRRHLSRALTIWQVTSQTSPIVKQRRTNSHNLRNLFPKTPRHIASTAHAARLIWVRDHPGSLSQRFGWEGLRSSLTVRALILRERRKKASWTVTTGFQSIPSVGELPKTVCTQRTEILAICSDSNSLETFVSLHLKSQQSLVGA